MCCQSSWIGLNDCYKFSRAASVGQWQPDWSTILPDFSEGLAQEPDWLPPAAIFNVSTGR